MNMPVLNLKVIASSHLLQWPLCILRHTYTFNRVLLTANVDIFPGVAGSIGWFGAVPRLKSKDLTLIQLLPHHFPLKWKSASNSPCLLPFIIPWKEKKKKPLFLILELLRHISAPASFSTCPRGFSFKSCQFSLLLNTVIASHPCFLTCKIDQCSRPGWREWVVGYPAAIGGKWQNRTQGEQPLSFIHFSTFCPVTHQAKGRLSNEDKAG